MADVSKDAEAIIRRIQTQAVPTVTAADAEILLASPKRTLMMDKLLAVHFNAVGDIARALDVAMDVFTKEPTSENAKNCAILLRRAKRLDEGVAFCEREKAAFNEIEWNDVLAMLHSDLGDKHASARHGTASLTLKDRAAPSAPAITPVLRPFDPEARSRNVITFSLWGSDQKYLAGALNNAIVARYLYPGWTARFYVDASVPEAFRQQLMVQGAQIVVTSDKLPAARFGLFWRFLVEDDPNVDIYLVRDADSVMNIKERAAVEDWLASGKAFHVMRDLPTHAELILAGMWGAHRGNIGNMAKRIRAHVDGAEKKLNNKITDQEFLRNRIWPIVKQDVLMHDAWLDFGNPVRFREEFQLPDAYHIGQNDWIHRRGGTPRRVSGGRAAAAGSGEKAKNDAGN